MPAPSAPAPLPSETCKITDNSNTNDNNNVIITIIVAVVVVAIVIVAILITFDSRSLWLRVGSDGVWITSAVCYTAGPVDWICVRLPLARGKITSRSTWSALTTVVLFPDSLRSGRPAPEHTVTTPRCTVP